MLHKGSIGMRQRAEGIIKKVMDALGSFYTVNYRHVHLPTFVKIS